MWTFSSHGDGTADRFDFGDAPERQHLRYVHLQYHFLAVSLLFALIFDSDSVILMLRSL